MLALPRSVQVFMAVEPVDMRKSIDGLLALVQHSFGHDAFSGHLYVFLGRRADRVKILTYERGGFVLYYKRLEQGRFRRPTLDEQQRVLMLDGTQLAMLLDGIDLSTVSRPQGWQPPSQRTAAASSSRAR